MILKKLCILRFFSLILGFIRINTAALGDSDTYVEVLDGSRIHPEAYDWAKKMAVDALEMDEDEGNPANALEEILQGPAKLHELNLEAFAQELERQGLGKKLVSYFLVPENSNINAYLVKTLIFKHSSPTIFFYFSSFFVILDLK